SASVASETSVHLVPIAAIERGVLLPIHVFARVAECIN
ncbi:hypothetical protein MNBD_ACTINO02-877, partial [hydrothermal vent metagenome]